MSKTQSLTGFLEAVKSASDLSMLLKQDGCKVIREGSGRLKTCCPFHSESTPSCVLYPDQRYHCFGCQARGDVIDYLMIKRGMGWWEAAILLAKAAGIEIPELSSEDAEAIDLEREQALALEEYTESCHASLMLNGAAIAYLADRGIRMDTLVEEKIGLANVDLPGKWSEEFWLDLGVLSKDEESGRVYQTLYGRIVFPVRRSGKVVNLSGRAYLKSEAKPKYKNLGNGRPVVPHGIDDIRGPGPCALVEGVIDRIILKQDGVPSAATIGTSIKDEWLVWFRKGTQYVALYDVDANGAGQAGTARVCDKLTERGLRVSVGVLPEGMDPDEVVKAHGIGAIQQIILRALPWLDHFINSLQVPDNPFEQEDVLQKKLFPRLWWLPEMAREHYLQVIKDKFGFKLPALRKAWATWLKAAHEEEEQAAKAQEQAGGEEKKSGKLRPVFRAQNPTLFNPAQAFVGNLGIYCAHCEAEGSTELHPFLITSDRRALLLSPETVQELSLLFRANKYPGEEVRWPLGSIYRFSVGKWLEGEAQANPKALFYEVRALLKRHIHWEPELEAMYDTLALWIIGTYVHQLFDSYPYLHFRGMAGSGKTTALRIIEGVGFNGTIAADITESVVSRSVNAGSCTLCIDEAEGFRRNARDENSVSIFAILNAGYKKGAVGQKAGSKKDGFRPERFDVFSPKVLGSIEPIDPTLSTRCIDVPMLKTAKKIATFLPEEIDHALQELRGHCYCWGLSAWKEVSTLYRSLEAPEGWINRGWELWKPLVTLARYYSAVTGEDLEAKLLILADTVKRAKQSREAEQNSSNRIIAALVDFVRDNWQAHPDNFYPTSVLCMRVQEETGWKEFSPERLSRFLFEESQICQDRESDRKKMHSPTAMRRVWHNRLDPARLAQKAVDLFSFPPELLQERWANSTSPDVGAEDPFEEPPENTFKNPFDGLVDGVVGD